MTRLLGKHRSPVQDLKASRSQSRDLAVTAHRPWALPQRPWLMGQSWLNLLFAHWRVPLADLKRVVPAQLPIDVIDGSAWIGVTPFELRAFRLRRTPPAPIFSAFLELNVRTYVTVGDKPGIYFLSLDAEQRSAVFGARRTYRLPYFHSRMSATRGSAWVEYESERRDNAGPPAALRCRYRPEGPTFNAAPGSVDAALIERYCAYTLDEEGAISRAQIHHRPWELQSARAEFEVNSMTQGVNVPLEGEPLLHFAPRQDVVLWPLEPA